MKGKKSIVLYQYDNKWHKEYVLLLMLIFLFLAPMLIASLDGPGGPNYSLVTLPVYCVFLLGNMLFTQIKGRPTFFESLKNDETFRAAIFWKGFAILVILSMFAYQSWIK